MSGASPSYCGAFMYTSRSSEVSDSIYACVMSLVYVFMVGKDISKVKTSRWLNRWTVWDFLAILVESVWA